MKLKTGTKLHDV